MKKYLLSVIIPLTLSFCTGASYQSDNQIKIPYISDYSTDGNFEEWTDIPSTKLYANALGEYSDPVDLDVNYKMGWSEEGLLFWLEIRDDVFRWDTINPWRSDALEFFMAPFSGSDEIAHITMIPDPAKPNKPFFKNNGSNKENKRTGPSEFLSYSKFEDGRLIIEGKIMNELIADSLKENSQINFQVYVLDSDNGQENRPGLVQWHSLGHSYMNSFAMHKVRLARNESFLFQGTSRAVITDSTLKISVFGAAKGDSIEFYRNDSCLYKKYSITQYDFQPDTFIFTRKELDFEKDSLSIFINRSYAGAHDLFIAPRFYEKLKPKAFEREIRVYKMKDRLNPPSEGVVLFVGSSSIRMWEELKKDFPDMNVLNRGFGGSTAADVMMYMDDIVLPYKPSMIFYYEGDNDLARGIEPESIQAEIQKFIKIVNHELPGTMIFLLSPKPAFTRLHLWGKYLELHERMKETASRNEKADFINVSEVMFDDEGFLRPEIFKEDGLHMNRKGYLLWTKKIKETVYLKPAK